MTKFLLASKLFDFQEHLNLQKLNIIDEKEITLRFQTIENISNNQSVSNYKNPKIQSNINQKLPQNQQTPLTLKNSKNLNN